MSHVSKSKTFPPSLKFLEFGVKITRKNLNRFRLPRDSEPSNLGSISPPLQLVREQDLLHKQTFFGVFQQLHVTKKTKLISALTLQKTC